MSSPWTLNKLAKEQGVTVKALLKKACQSYRLQRDAAASLGLTVHGFNFACQRNGITWDHSRTFEFMGRRDTMIGHCNRYGLNAKKAYLYRHKKACSKAEALKDLIAQRQAVAA